MCNRIKSFASKFCTVSTAIVAILSIGFSVSEFFGTVYADNELDIKYNYEYQPLSIRNIEEEVSLINARMMPESTIESQNSEIEEVAPTHDIDLIYSTITMSDEEFELFCRVVETEVRGDTYYEEKMHVAQVIANRVLDPRFPNTLKGVLTSPKQFSSVYKGEITETTKQVVRDVLYTGYDTTDGALYFCSGDVYFNNLDFIFTDGVGHRFYKN